MMECNCSECIGGCDANLDFPDVDYQDTNFELELELEQRLDEIDQLELESKLLNELRY